MFPLIAKSILSHPPPERSVMEMNAWNPDDASPNIVVLDDDALTCRRLPSVSNDFIVECIRGKIGYTTGYHIWQIKWTNCGEADTVVVGVATSSAELHDVDSVIGSTADSFGWDLIGNKCYHDLKNHHKCTYPIESMNGADTLMVPNTILCLLDMDEGTLSFAADGYYLGVAFRHLNGMQLYPLIGTDCENCEITIRYLGCSNR